MNPRTRHSFINQGNKRNHNPHASLYFGDRAHHHHEGSFFGIGPIGYRRADERILDDAVQALTRNSYLDASKIEVKVHAAVVTLSGTVSNREMKVLAEDCVDKVSGVQDVSNEISLTS